MEGADLVEGVALASFPIDGPGVTEFLARWIRGLRFLDTTRALVLGGVTLAGLAVVDVTGLAAALARPVLVVNRREPSDHRVRAALRAAGLAERASLLARTPVSQQMGPGLWAAFAGADAEQVRGWLEASRRKSALPEALRMAHLIAAAVARGSSRGRA